VASATASKAEQEVAMKRVIATPVVEGTLVVGADIAFG
jgi:hypothetical protein